MPARRGGKLPLRVSPSEATNIQVLQTKNGVTVGYTAHVLEHLKNIYSEVSTTMFNPAYSQVSACRIATLLSS